MQKRFVSASAQIVDPPLSPTSPIQSSPPKPKEPEPDPNDKRSLFERLNAAKAKKQEAFEEAYKFSNLVKRLDDTESDYIAHLNQENAKEEREKRKIVGEQVDAFKKAQSALDTTRKPTVQDFAPPPPPPPPKRRESSNLKGLIVKRKSESQGGDPKRRRSSTTESSPIIDKKPSSTSPVSRTNSISSKTPSIEPVNKTLTGFEDYGDSDSESDSS